MPLNYVCDKCNQQSEKSVVLIGSKRLKVLCENCCKEIEDEMNKTMQYYKNSNDLAKNIDMERLYNYTKGVLENEKVFEMLEKL